MLKKLIISVVVLLFFPIISGAHEKNDSIRAREKSDTLPSFIGLSYIPALNWKIFNINNENGTLKYVFKLNAQTSIEGNYNIKKIGLKLGLSASFENNKIEKAYQYAGYLSIKNYWLRIQSSKVSGMVEWSEMVPAGFLQKYDFTNKYFNIEILKTSNAYKSMSGGAEMNKILGTFWGIGYTSFKVPMRMGTLILVNNKQRFGIPGYDTLFSSKFYTACFGFDLLRQICLTHGNIGSIPGKPAMKFGMYASTQDKIGFGSGEYSDYGISMIETLNPGKKALSPKPFSVLVHYSLSVGFRYYVKVKPVFLLFAAGYDLEGASIMPFGKPPDNENDLSIESLFFYMNHGLSFKLYISRLGK